MKSRIVQELRDGYAASPQAETVRLLRESLDTIRQGQEDLAARLEPVAEALARLLSEAQATAEEARLRIEEVQEAAERVEARLDRLRQEVSELALDWDAAVRAQVAALRRVRRALWRAVAVLVTVALVSLALPFLSLVLRP